MDWKYPGKFKDRTPKILSAGAPLSKCGKTADCLKIYPVDDAVETVLTEAGLHKIPIKNPYQLMGCRHPGIYTNMRSLLSANVESRYQTLLRDLKETTWESYWNKELGKRRDPSGSLPTHINDDFIFGTRKPSELVTVAELITPNVTPYEIAFNEAEFHEMYKKTHRDYMPAERVSRHYESPFDPSSCFGQARRARPTVACCIPMRNQQPVAMANNILADYIERKHAKIGRSLTQSNINCVEPGHRFGIKSVRPCYSVAELLHPKVGNSAFRKDFRVWLTALMEIRTTYKKRNIDFGKLFGYCKYADINNIGWINLEVFQKILNDNRLSYPCAEILPIAQCFGIFQEGLVNYPNMLNLFNIEIEMPPLHQFYNDYDASGDFLTTTAYEELAAGCKDNSKMEPAGIPSFRTDTTKVLLQTNQPQFERENLGDETRVSALINPSILTNYGLSQIDLMAPRKPEYIRKLFERLGYEFPPDVFDKLWEMGQSLECNNEVSVDTFRKLMDQAAPITPKEEPEDTCFRSNAVEKCPKKNSRR